MSELIEDQKDTLIAEHLGWTNVFTYKGSVTGTDPKGKPLQFVPNYHADLNACHEMEKALTRGLQRAVYTSHLTEICEGPEWSIIHATPAQRVEAFGRTMVNLW